ncbi:MAG: DinB family protein [Acidobacteriaceae bacterium]
MSANPYATFLGKGDAMQVIAATPSRLVAVASGLSGEQADAPTAPGKWSVRQIIAHMADCEIGFGFRLRQGLAGVAIQPFDQDAWAESYARYSMEAAVQTFSALRAWNVAFAKGLSDADKRKAVTHPERGEMTMWTLVETMAGHDLNHLGQLERTSAK